MNVKKCLIIYNPHSGKAAFKKALPEVVAKLETLGFTCNIAPTEYPRHATQLYKEAAFNKVDLVVVSGGDGTMNEIVNAVAKIKSPPPIGYLPSGTACDLAHTLGISKNIRKALAVIEANHLRKMDVVQSAQGYFAYVSAIGNYVDISYKANRRLKRYLGYAAYIIVGIKAFFTVPMIKADIYVDDQKKQGVYALILILNSRYVAGFDMIKQPTLDDQEVNVIAFPYVPLLNNVFFLLAFLLKIRKIPGVTYLKGKRVKVITNHHRAWNVDGEAANSGNQEIRVLPKAMPIYVHSKRLNYFKDEE